MEKQEREERKRKRWEQQATEQLRAVERNKRRSPKVWDNTPEEAKMKQGCDILPLPSSYPRQHRELLRAIAAARLDITMCQVNLRALDKAYSVAFPKSTPITISKKVKNEGAFAFCRKTQDGKPQQKLTSLKA